MSLSETQRERTLLCKAHKSTERQMLMVRTKEDSLNGTILSKESNREHIGKKWPEMGRITENSL